MYTYIIVWNLARIYTQRTGTGNYWAGDSPVTEGEREGGRQVTRWRCGDVLGERSGVRRSGKGGRSQNVRVQRRGEPRFIESTSVWCEGFA